MKTLKFILTICIVPLILSCTDAEQITDSQNSKILTDLSNIQLNTLKQIISDKISDNDVDVTKILGVRKFASINIVTYISNNEKKEIAFERLFGKEGKILRQNPGWTIYCTGEGCGGCPLEGVLDPDGIAYVQCKCTTCEMHIKD